MTFEQIKNNIQYGDYNLLQKILNAPTVAAARMRFLRGEDNEAIEAMQAIQENREEFIKKYQDEKSKSESEPGRILSADSGRNQPT